MTTKKSDFTNNSFTIEFINTYKTEVTPERINDFKMKLAGIESLAEKLAFCKIELKEYLQNIPAETMAASGNTGASNPIFFDRIIQLEIDNIQSLISTTSVITRKQVKSKIILTYNWMGKPQNLTVLHKEMRGVFIDKETKVKDFCNIFENLNTTSIKPVKWIRSATDLLQLLYDMMNAGLIKDETKRMNYQRLIACFCKEDGSQFNQAFRSIFEQIKKDFTPVKTDIKELVKKLK